MQFFVGLLGIIVGASVTIFFHLWKLRRDELSARADDLCESMIDVAGLAVDYWSIDAARLANQIADEAKINGGQALVDGLYAMWKPRLYKADADIIDLEFAKLVDCLTGGDFSVSGRLADTFRASTALQVAAQCVVAVRSAHRRTIPIVTFLDRFVAGRNIELDRRVF